MRGGFSAFSVNKHDVIILQTLVYLLSTFALVRPTFHSKLFRSEILGFHRGVIEDIALLGRYFIYILNLEDGTDTSTTTNQRRAQQPKRTQT
jgi:hypothetical protein